MLRTLGCFDGGHHTFARVAKVISPLLRRLKF